MNKIVLLLCSILLSNQAIASTISFIAKEKGKILKQEGDCDTAYAPQSTFKIALSLIGFDSGILKDDSAPSWERPKDEDSFINVCKADHDPHSWMRDSCLWYSRILTTKLGMDKFQKYVTDFAYGNMDLSGGLTSAWISSSLKISLNGQTDFLQKMIDRQFPLSQESYDKTEKIMFIQEMAGGWKLYGKTGNGQQIDNQGQRTDQQHGWFVGYLEKGDRRIVFAGHILDTEKQSTFASFRIRNETWIKLWYLINEFEQ